MKKLLAIALTIAMLAALCISASALFEAEEAFMEVAFNIGKAKTAWAADGVISDGEYYKVDIDPKWLSIAVGTDSDADQARNLNPELYMSWDENYVYMATQYTPVEHYNAWDGNEASMWICGAIQINYAEFDEQSSEYRLEYGVGLSSNTGNMLYTVWADGCGSGYTPTTEDAMCWDNDGTLLYETRCPWSAFYDGFSGRAGAGFNFCMVWSTGTSEDSGAGYVHTQLAEGCTGNGKHAEYFAQVRLGDVADDGSIVLPAKFIDTPTSSNYEIVGMTPDTYPGSGIEGEVLTGNVIGIINGWDGTAACGSAAAFDGSVDQYFDPLGTADGWAGLDVGEPVYLSKIAVCPRNGFLDRFAGGTFEATNTPDDEDSWVEIWSSDSAGETEGEYIIIPSSDMDNNYGYRYYRYINYTTHGDVGDIEFFKGTEADKSPEKVVEEKPAVEEKVEEVKEAVAEVAENATEAVSEVAEQAADAVSDAANTVAEAAKSGCGSFIGGGIAVIVSILGAAWVAGRKH